jgi:hypothetical protein
VLERASGVVAMTYRNCVGDVASLATPMLHGVGGNLKKVALVAAMRKYLTILNAMTRNHLKVAAAR